MAYPVPYNRWKNLTYGSVSLPEELTFPSRRYLSRVISVSALGQDLRVIKDLL